ncbi:MAG: hypothetical protein WA705_19585 [Candidatus Ozemobacteraceae bacterium]
MKKILTSVLASMMALALNLVPADAMSPEKWIDATHKFEKQTRELTKKVKRETKVDRARRTRAPAPVAKEFKVGDVETFWATNITDNKPYQLQATAKAVGTHCYIFVENGRTVTDTAVQAILNDFENRIYKNNTTYFGSEWKPGIDGDERLTLLLLDIQDGWNAESNQGYVAGYFFAGDEYLQSQIPADIPVKSNEREMLYLDVSPADPSSQNYLGVVAHEFQHMIHFAHDPQENTWVNESCSMIAMWLNGYGHQNQIRSFLEMPDTSLTAWAESNMLANYGEVYLWNFFIMNRLLPNEASRVEFFSKLVNSQAQGVAGYDEALKPFNTDFQKMYTEFAIANISNNPKLDQGQYCYRDETLNRLRLPATQVIKAFPGQVQNTVGIWSADAIKVDLAAAKSKVKIEIGGAWAEFRPGEALSYTAAAILSDARNAQTPEITFIKLERVPGQKMQAGSLELTLNGKFDTLTLMVSAQAPTTVPDAGYAKVAGVPYVVQITDGGEIVATATPLIVSARPVSMMAEEYRQTAASLAGAGEQVLTQGLTTLEATTDEVINSVRADLEKGATTSIDELLTAGSSSDEAARTALRPLARKVADQLSAARAHEGRTNLDERINLLRSF